MKIVIAPDSFKGSANSISIAQNIQAGIQEILPTSTFIISPVADGGEGTVEASIMAGKGRLEETTVRGPLGEAQRASWALVADKNTAVIEMAAASGLPLVPAEQRNPLYTSSYGTGELIKTALDRGCDKLIIGLGGSATNDGGLGMAQALGVSFLNSRNEELPLGAKALAELERIDISGLDPRIKDCSITIASDVSNPLVGEFGASVIYGPQKGATPSIVKELDLALAHLARICKEQLAKDFADVAGAGAAGGLGFGLMCFCNARMASGIDTILDSINFDEKLEGADLVITGEGRLDGQSIFGKVPVGVAARAKKRNIPVIAIVGGLGAGAEKVYDYGIDALLPLVNRPMSLDLAMAETQNLLYETGKRLALILQIGNKLKI